MTSNPSASRSPYASVMYTWKGEVEAVRWGWGWEGGYLDEGAHGEELLLGVLIGVALPGAPDANPVDAHAGQGPGEKLSRDYRPIPADKSVWHVLGRTVVAAPCVPQTMHITDRAARCFIQLASSQCLTSDLSKRHLNLPLPSSPSDDDYQREGTRGVCMCGKREAKCHT